jgi:hypothetical protein
MDGPSGFLSIQSRESQLDFELATTKLLVYTFIPGVSTDVMLIAAC